MVVVNWEGVSQWVKVEMEDGAMEGLSSSKCLGSVSVGVEVLRRM